MTSSASPRVTAYATLAALFLLSALAFRRPELVVLAVPFALPLAVGLHMARQPEIRVWLTLERERALEEDELGVQLVVGCETPVERLELLLVLPDGLEVASGASTVSVRLGWDDERTIELRLRCVKWGNYQVGDIRLRARDRLGLLVWEQQLDLKTLLRVYPLPETLRRIVPPGGHSAFHRQRGRTAEGRGAGVRRPARLRSRRPRPLDQLARERAPLGPWRASWSSTSGRRSGMRT